MPGGATAQVIGTGPTVRYSAMPEMFESLMFAARREIVVTTPYYVPDESLQNALCTTAYRGVDTTIVFPARNDSWIVGAASRSYYADLLAAGVKIYEYEGGLLHTKSLTLDGEVTLIGSANMDRRSFELNYENNILFHDPALTGADARAPAGIHRAVASRSRRRRWRPGRCHAGCGTTSSPRSGPCSDVFRVQGRVIAESALLAVLETSVPKTVTVKRRVLSLQRSIIAPGTYVGTRGKGEVNTGTNHLGFRCVTTPGLWKDRVALEKETL